MLHYQPITYGPPSQGNPARLKTYFSNLHPRQGYEGLDLSLKCQTIELNPRQYAREGHSASDALIYLHQAIHRAADRDCGAKIFLADISKGFDIIDHSVLLTELASFSIDPALINWIKAFLISRSQAELAVPCPSGNHLSEEFRKELNSVSSCLLL